MTKKEKEDKSTYSSCKECGSITNTFYSSDINNGLVCRECYDKRRDI